MYVYIQLNVYEESQEYLTINTHKGLYSYKKLPYGVKCVCKQDDILVSSNDWQENLKILVEVWDRLQQYYLHLKLSKWEFLKPEVVYLHVGQKISPVGLQQVEEKINAVKKAPAPWNILSE